MDGKEATGIREGLGQSGRAGLPSCLRVSRWHVCISGFSQREGDPCGITRLWQRLRRQADPWTCVEHRTWHSDWSEVAEFIWAVSINGIGPAINIYAYSWGAGYGFVQLARELGRRGLTVDQAILCDPVYRSRLVSLRWLAMTPWGAIPVPPNVRQVRWTRQAMSWPRAHELRPEDPTATVIHPPVPIKASHTYMDEHPVYQAMALGAAGISGGPLE